MNESLFEQIQNDAKYLKLDLRSQKIAQLAVDKSMSQEGIQSVAGTLRYLKDKKSERNVSTLLKLSRLPLKEPKTFENFDFSQFHGQHVESLKNLPTLTSVYARKNMAFIGVRPVQGKLIWQWPTAGNAASRGRKPTFLKQRNLIRS